MSFEWDPMKDEANFRKHGIRFAEAESVYVDDFALTIADDESDCHRGKNIRIISARLAEAHERVQYEEHR